ncbi:hypothetical protein, partial [Photobacterium sp. DNB22_13_2]
VATGRVSDHANSTGIGACGEPWIGKNGIERGLRLSGAIHQNLCLGLRSGEARSIANMRWQDDDQSGPSQRCRQFTV